MALAGVLAAAFFAKAATLAANAVFFAVAALRAARVLLVFATVMLLLLFPLRRAAFFVVMFSVYVAQSRRGTRPSDDRAPRLLHGQGLAQNTPTLMDMFALKPRIASFAVSGSVMSEV